MLSCVMSLLSLMFFSTAAAVDTHAFSVRDMQAMDRISDPRVSPDGKRVVFTLRSTDLEANRGRTDIWIVGIDGSGSRRLTANPASDSGARWAPDGKSIYFLSTRSGSSQVWNLPLEGGEAQQVTAFPLDVSNLVVSPDGQRLAASAEVFPDCATLSCTQERLDARAKQKASGQLYDRLFIRHWDSWKDGRRSHLFSFPAAGGEAVDVTRGMDADVPSKPFGGTEELAFTLDSRALVFAARVAGSQEAWSTNFDLYTAPADGSGPPRNLTAANLATDTAPAFSPDGKTLAYLAMSRPGYESDCFRIMVKPWPDGAPRALALDWDRSPSDLTWSTDGKNLYATAGNTGRTSLYALDVATGKARVLVEGGTVASPSPAGDRIVFALDTLRAPAELHTTGVDGSTLTPITRINAERVALARLGDYEQFTFKGWNDETVHAYVVKPVDFDPAKKYPVAFLIHGGPQGSFGDNFHYRWNAQAFAGAGYASVMVDFHGSTGYGQAFTDSIRGDWGGKPLVDLQKGLDAAIARYPFLSGDRVAALGGSYGGYMVNWIAGNWPNRFRCLVSHDGNLDERLAYFDTEELWFPEWDHEGTPWDNPQGYEKHNPIQHVAKWKTPMLVVHGALDYRVVDTQGMSTFTTLQRRGIPSKFLYFPDEGHWVLKPANGILWYDTVLAWLDQWTKK